MFNIETLRSKSLSELTKISKDLGVKIPRNSTEETIVEQGTHDELITNNNVYKKLVELQNFG